VKKKKQKKKLSTLVPSFVDCYYLTQNIYNLTFILLFNLFMFRFKKQKKNITIINIIYLKIIY
jgi:hypothetical protein